jgi:hypothetical protein
MYVKIRVCLPRKYGRFMLFIDVFVNNSVLNLHFMKVSTENDNTFGYEKITIVVDNIPLRRHNV